MSNYVSSLCASMQIPHLELRLDTEETKSAHALTVNLYPSPSELSKSITDLIAYYGWEQVLVLYGNKEGEWRG